MISVEKQFHPSNEWMSEERTAVADALQINVLQRFNGHQPLTDLEVVDVVNRLCLLLSQSAEFLEKYRDRILIGRKDPEEE
ncbi:MAG: hypothetical protein Q7R63_02320 [bacterium]|nr:hypothetical protein [bacterium]